MENEEYNITKLEAAGVHLEASIGLMLREQYPEAIHTLISAAKTVLWDLNKIKENVFIKKVEASRANLILPGYEKEYRRYEKRAANFFKHADSDPNAVLSGYDFQKLNEIDLLLCILAYQNYVAPLTQRLVLGLSYLGFRSGKWFDFEAFAKQAGMNMSSYEDYAQMSKQDLQNLTLKAYECSQANHPSPTPK